MTKGEIEGDKIKAIKNFSLAQSFVRAQKQTSECIKR